MCDVLGIEKCSSDCWVRHPLAFLVEAADDICYSIIDLEDGCTIGLVSFEETLELLKLQLLLRHLMPLRMLQEIK